MEEAAHTGQLLGNDGIEARILQADGIDQSAAAFGDTRDGIAEAWGNSSALEGDCAQDVEVVEVFEFFSETEGSACGDYGIVQPYAGEIDAEIYHITSSFLNTGPSLQMRLGPLVISWVHPTQAPKPQAILSSRLTRPPRSLERLSALSIGTGPQA